MTGRSVQIYEKLLFFSSFNLLGPFSQDFREAKEWPISKLREKIRASHSVVCPIVFILFYDRDWQGGVLKLMKNDYFLVFF